MYLGNDLTKEEKTSTNKTAALGEKKESEQRGQQKMEKWFLFKSAGIMPICLTLNAQ